MPRDVLKKSGRGRKSKEGPKCGVKNHFWMVKENERGSSGG